MSMYMGGKVIGKMMGKYDEHIKDERIRHTKKYLDRTKSLLVSEKLCFDPSKSPLVNDSGMEGTGPGPVLWYPFHVRPETY